MKLRHSGKHLAARIFFWASIAGLLACSAVLKAQTTDLKNFAQTFKTPPENARPEVRWWWFGPAVTKPELARELEQMKQGGFGGFEIQPVYPLALSDPQTGFHNFPYLSPEFLDDVRFVNQQAHKLGLRVNLTLSSGWPYGGPHTPVTLASCELKMDAVPISAATDSAPVPFLENGDSLVAVFLAGADWAANGAGEQPKMLPLPVAGAARVTLPAGAARDGEVLLWFISTRTGQQVKRAAIGAAGFVLDHFSQQAVANHLTKVAGPLMTAFGSEPPFSVFSDSLEVYGADWTPRFLEEFRQLRGYDLLPHLPELFMRNPTEEALEVRHDWGLTLTQLIDKNYLEQIDSWALAHRTQFRSQSYGFPAVSLSSNAFVSLPEGEGPQWRQFSFMRWASSASHVYGRNVTSSETWTWLHSPPFRATPLDMKAEADCFFLEGSNQLMGHGWPYSPPSAGNPGWNFYAAGALNAHNPWWIVMPGVTRYLQRVSWVLRQGRPDNDVAVYLPEDDAWADFTPGRASITALMPRWITPQLTQTIEESGYNLDYIDGAAIAARGIHYPVLIMPNVDRISSATLASIQKYVQQGGKVIAIGRIPGQAPGFENHARDSANVAAEAHALFNGESAHGDATLVPGVDALATVLKADVHPDLTLSAAAPLVGFIHRKLADADIYFIANTGNEAVKTQAGFRDARPAAEWLDPDTGAIVRAAMDHGSVALGLAPYESRILLLHDGAAIGAPPAKAGGTAGGRMVADLSDGWNVRFDSGNYAEKMSRLVSWTENPKTLYYSGVATYTRNFDLPSGVAHGAQVILSFGEGTPIQNPPRHMGTQALLNPPIREAAVVLVNGRQAGALWHPPYTLDIASLLKPGANILEVRVANTAINERSGASLPDYPLLWARYGRRFEPQDMNNLEPLPSGILGSVKLIAVGAP
ncbi:MAG: glycosyl hydrolase [Terracidiphilus sp.]